MPRGLRVLLWTARIVATLIVAIVVLMLVGYAVNPQGDPATPGEPVLLALFPIGMCQVTCLPGDGRLLEASSAWRASRSS